MGTNLYVGNLPFTCSEDELRAHFETAGQVARCSVITDKATGRSRGFGFVEMTNQADTDKVVAELHGKPFMGRPLTVNEARPREERPRGGGGGGGGFGGGDRRGGGSGGFGGGRRDRY